MEIPGLPVARHFSLVLRTGPEPQGAAGAFREFALARGRILSGAPKRPERTRSSPRKVQLIANYNCCLDRRRVPPANSTHEQEAVFCGIGPRGERAAVTTTGAVGRACVWVGVVASISRGEPAAGEISAAGFRGGVGIWDELARSSASGANRIFVHGAEHQLGDAAGAGLGYLIKSEQVNRRF